MDFKHGEPGDNVAVPTPLADRGSGNPRNILGVIVHKDLETDIYKIAAKARVLKGGFSSNQLYLCPKKLLNEDVSLDTSVSLRSAVTAQSASGGQEFTKCNSSGPPPPRPSPQKTTTTTTVFCCCF